MLPPTSAEIAHFLTAHVAPYIIFSLALLVPFIVIERLWPALARPPWRLYGLNMLIAAVTTAVVPAGAVFAANVADWLRPRLPWRTIELTFTDIGIGIPFLDPVLQVLAMILIPMLLHDVWFYWAHRLEHRVPLLWQFHRLHHSDPNMNATTFSRDHILQQIYRACFSMLTLGLIFDLDLRQAQQAALYSGLASALLSVFYHSAIRVHVPWLDRIIVTPQVHRIHHSTAAHHYNRNFADNFPIFDMLFGTFEPTRKEEFPETGLVDWCSRTLWAAQFEPIMAALRVLTRKT